MKKVQAIVRPEKVADVLAALYENDFHAATRISVLGRGKQSGLKVAQVHYDEIPKEMLVIVVNDDEVEKVTEVIIDNARTDFKGAFGDGKIFVSDVECAYTISTGEKVERL